MHSSSIGKLISIISRQTQNYISREMQRLGITGSEYIFLVNTPDEGEITQQEICNQFELDPAYATRGVKSLVAKGLLNREKSTIDKRSYEITLTDEGRLMKPKIQKVLDHWTDVLAGDMSQEEKDDIIETLMGFKTRANEEISR